MARQASAWHPHRTRRSAGSCAGSARRDCRGSAVGTVGPDAPRPIPGRRRSAPSRAWRRPRASACGRRAPASSRSSRGGERTRARAGGPRRVRGRAAGGARHATTPTSSTASGCPIRARAGSRTACAARRACSTPARSRWTDDGWTPPALRDLVLYELHVGTFTPEGTFEAAIPHLRGAARARRHRDRADAGRRVPGPPRLGLRRRLHLRAALGVRRPARPAAARRRRARRGPRGDPRRRLQPPRRVGRRGDGGVRPVPDRQVRDALGQGGQPRRRASPTPCASGSCSRPSSGSATSTSTALRLDAIHALLDSNPEHIVAALARRVHAREPARARDRRVRHERPEGDARRRARRLGLRRRLGRRLPPRAARRAHRRDGRLVRGVRRPRRRSSRRSIARTSTTARSRRSAAAASARRADDVAPERFVVFSSNHDQVGNRAFGDRLPVEARPLAALLTLSGTVHADALPGRGLRRARPVPASSPTTSTRRSPSATREGRRREFAAFAAFGEEIPDPQDPATFERSKLTRAGEPAGMRELYARRAGAARASCRAGGATPRPTAGG